MNNPYSWNRVNTNIFYGRERLLGRLLTNLPGSPGESFGIAGGRRMGKTTLLRRVEEELKTGIEQWKAGGLLVMPIYIDGLTLPYPLNMERLWGHLLKLIRPFLPALPDIDVSDYYTFAQALRVALFDQPHRPRLIFMFDEVEPIASVDWGYYFFDNWRALLSNSDLSEYCTAVFTGAHDLFALRRELTSPLWGALTGHDLRLFDFEDSCRLMQEPIDVEWPDALLERTYAETGGHPMLIQYVMQQICRNDPENAQVSLEHAVRQFGEEQRWQFSEWWNRFCLPLSQRVYSRLPDDGSTMSRGELVNEFGYEVDRALELLQHVGIVMSEDGELAYRYAGEMFRRWYRSNGTIADVPLHDPEVYLRLNRVGSVLGDKYLSAWRTYQSEMPDYTGVLVQLRGVLEYLVETHAPNAEVMAAPDFKLEKEKTEPTLRQRVRYVARRLYDNERTKEVVNDYNLLEIECDQVAQMATKAARAASGIVHTRATRDRALRALKQWDVILLQLLPDVKREG